MGPSDPAAAPAGPVTLSVSVLLREVLKDKQTWVLSALRSWQKQNLASTRVGEQRGLKCHSNGILSQLRIYPTRVVGCARLSSSLTKSVTGESLKGSALYCSVNFLFWKPSHDD